jgi:hypothetical protein
MPQNGPARSALTQPFPSSRRSPIPYEGARVLAAQPIACDAAHGRPFTPLAGLDMDPEDNDSVRHLARLMGQLIQRVLWGL